MTRSSAAPFARSAVRILCAGMALAALMAAASQQGQSDNQGLAMRMVAARQAAAAKLHGYSWNTRTELVMDGQVKDVRVEQVQYGPDGNLQRTQVSDQQFNMPRGFLRRAIAENQLKQVEQHLQGLRALLDQYTLPTADKVMAFMAAAQVQFAQGPDGNQYLRIQGSSIVQPGDSLTMWADPTTRTLRRIDVTTTYDGKSATVTAGFTTNRAGLTYMSMAEVNVPDQKLSLQVHHYDFEPLFGGGGAGAGAGGGAGGP